MKKKERDIEQEIIGYLYGHRMLVQIYYMDSQYAKPDSSQKHTIENYDEKLNEYYLLCSRADFVFTNFLNELIIEEKFDDRSNNYYFALTDKYRGILAEFDGNYREYKRVTKERNIQKEIEEKARKQKEHKKEINQIRFNTATTFIAVLGLLIQGVIGMYEVFKPEPKIVIQSTDSLLNYNIEVLKSIDSNINKLVKIQDSILKSDSIVKR